MSIALGVNIDHVVTLWQARGTRCPDPVYAAQIKEQSGADSITLLRREDRRPIQERDALVLKEVVPTNINLAIAIVDEMLDSACNLQPEDVCLIPEKREELATEGSLDVAGDLEQVKQACRRLAKNGTRVSPFIDARQMQIDAVVECGAVCIEIHTGHYADAPSEDAQHHHLVEINSLIEYTHSKGLQVNAEHGSNDHNVQSILRNALISEFNIGHAIIADSIFNGLSHSAREMERLMVDARL